MDDRELKRRMDPELPASMQAHIARVVALAEGFAQHHHLDVARARLMAQAHDLVRAVPPEELLARAEERANRGELTISDLERRHPVLLHGPLGALELGERFGLDDADVLHAVHWHTTGHPDYSDEAWAMFVADKVDPWKVERWSALAEVHELADEDLRRAAARFLDLTADRTRSEGGELHPQVEVTRASLPDPDRRA